MDRFTKFRCLPLACTMAAGTCADRQRDAIVGLSRNDNGGALTSRGATRFTPFVSCRGCMQGRSIVAEIGASPPREERLLTRAPGPPGAVPITADVVGRRARIYAARRRGLAIAQANRRARPVCGNGHPYPAAVTFDRNGGRICRACLTANNRAYRARKRAA